MLFVGEWGSALMKALLLVAALAFHPQPGQTWADADCYDAIIVKDDGSVWLVLGSGKELRLDTKDVEMIAKDRIVYRNKLFVDPGENVSVCD